MLIKFVTVGSARYLHGRSGYRKQNIYFVWPNYPCGISFFYIKTKSTRAEFAKLPGTQNIFGSSLGYPFSYNLDYTIARNW